MNFFLRIIQNLSISIYAYFFQLFSNFQRSHEQWVRHSYILTFVQIRRELGNKLNKERPIDKCTWWSFQYALPEKTPKKVIFWSHAASTVGKYFRAKKLTSTSLLWSLTAEIKEQVPAVANKSLNSCISTQLILGFIHKERIVCSCELWMLFNKTTQCFLRQNPKLTCYGLL